MSTVFRREIDELKQKLLFLCGLTEQRIHEAVKALLERDHQLADNVIHGDTAIDDMEVELEEECLKILALHQPVAGDLRFIVAVLKINNDLERVGDLAVNIAKKARVFASYPQFIFPVDLQQMSTRTEAMLHDSLDALVALDTELARDVCLRDEQVNAMKRANRKTILEDIQNSPEQADLLMRLLAVSRNLERVGDFATNICEDIVYLVEGEIVRHQLADETPPVT